MRFATAVIVIGFAVVAPRAEADGRDDRARSLYLDGQAAFRGERYQAAYDRFRQAYLLVEAPELLYNMASALERLGRPHDAAEELRAYLRAKPEDTERGLIDGRIRALDEAQRLIDSERLRNEPPRLIELPAGAGLARRRKTLAAVLGTLGGVVVAGALGVGLGLGLRQEYTLSTLHTQRATP
jgi:tetratricopeptide (TPR) repeat protein